MWWGKAENGVSEIEAQNRGKAWRESRKRKIKAARHTCLGCGGKGAVFCPPFRNLQKVCQSELTYLLSNIIRSTTNSLIALKLIVGDLWRPEIAWVALKSALESRLRRE